MKNKKNLNFIEEYKKSWNFIRESKKFIYSIVGIFFIFSLIGFFITTPTLIAEQILKFIEELLLKTQDMGHFELIKFIFFNNTQSSFFGMIFGALFGIFSVVTTIANGYLLGFVSAMVVSSKGFGVLWRLAPHGIFELPALFISLGLGLKLGMFFLEKDKAKTFRNYLWNSLRVFLYIIIPLLLVAALIEGTLIFFSS